MVRAVTGRIRVALVDEVGVREQLRHLLDSVPDVEIVGTGTTHGDALALASTAAPDLMFLGIRLPDLNGMAAFEAMPAARRSAVAFVADREEYAYRAFELQALDYLLCPLDPARVERVVSRARRELLSEGRLARSAPGTLGAQTAQRRLLIKSPDQLTFVDLDEIDWIESAGNQVRVHAGPATYVSRVTMGAMEMRLDARFVRIHRSAMVNAMRIRGIRQDRSERVSVILKDGTVVTADGHIHDRLAEWLNHAC